MDPYWVSFDPTMVMLSRGRGVSSWRAHQAQGEGHNEPEVPLIGLSDNPNMAT